MKTDERFEDTDAREADHDSEWREKIQRALRDLRSTSGNSGLSAARPQAH